jgi:hypothetical protein
MIQVFMRECRASVEEQHFDLRIIAKPFRPNFEFTNGVFDRIILIPAVCTPACSYSKYSATDGRESFSHRNLLPVFRNCSCIRI